MVGGGRPGGLAVLLLGLVMWRVAGASAAPAQAELPRAEPLWVGTAQAESPRAESLRADTTRAALDAIGSCALKLNPDIDIGYDRVVARCPSLVRRLDESGWSVWLPHDWQRPGNDLSAGGLRELRELLSREVITTIPRERGHVPSVERVPDVLASLARTGGEHSNWWARTGAWLRNVFERSEPAADEGWLARMIGQSGLSQAVIELVSYAGLVLVAVLAVAIVVNELRVGKVFGRLRRRFAVLADSPVTGQRDGLTWNDVQRASPLQRPGLMLELLVARLTEGSRLQSARGLTVRELTYAAQLSDEKDRERLAQLARTSERVRFSGTEVSTVDIDAAVEGGRVLLARISPSAAGGAYGGGL
jgi:hypothetical protein